MIGLAIGVVAGGVQFWLLSMFTARITSGAGITVQAALLMMLQLLIPLIALVAVLLLRRTEILPAALGIVGVLVVGAFIKFVLIARKTRGRRDNNG